MRHYGALFLGLLARTPQPRCIVKCLSTRDRFQVSVNSRFTVPIMSSPTAMLDERAQLQFVCSRLVTNLFKETLMLLERLADEHDEALGKLAVALPAEYRTHLELADWYTEDKGQRLRKEVLDRGNACRKAVLEEIDKYRISI